MMIFVFYLQGRAYNSLNTRGGVLTYMLNFLSYLDIFVYICAEKVK